MNTYERYLIVLDILKKSDTEKKDSLFWLLDKLIKACLGYVDAVDKMEHRVNVARFRLEGEELRELIQKLDTNRRHAHEALLSTLYAFNRNFLAECEDAPVGGIYSYSPESIKDRVAVANWAGELVKELYDHRVL